MSSILHSGILKKGFSPWPTPDRTPTAASFLSRWWKAQDGMIIGSTEGSPLEYNSFLCTKKTYANFILRAQAKLRNHNSGIQFRSELVPDLKWAVRAYQADMAENSYWGCIYEER